MSKIINRTNFFDSIKLTKEGYIECRLEPYKEPKEQGIDQYKVFQNIKLDESGRLKITQKN